MGQWDEMYTRDYRVECGTEWDVPCVPMGEWDWMDTRDYRVERGTEWDVPCTPMVRWDGMDTRVECGTEWDVPCSLMHHSGTGWTAEEYTCRPESVLGLPKSHWTVCGNTGHEWSMSCLIYSCHLALQLS